jgi:hypothetical protein
LKDSLSPETASAELVKKHLKAIEDGNWDLAL